MEMIAAQAAHSAGAVFGDEDAVATDEKTSVEEKKDVLQRAFIMAASNGNVESVDKILNGKAKEFVDVNAPDDEGTPALIYACCFVSTSTECPTTVLVADFVQRDTSKWHKPSSRRGPT